MSWFIPWGRALTEEEYNNMWREFEERRARRFNSAGKGAGRINTVTDDEANRNNPALKPTEDKKEASQLKPVNIDYLIQQNEPLHHTDEYDEDAYGLVVRRGQEFQVEVTFDRAYDPKQDQLILQLTFGSRPQESKNTLIRIKVRDDKNLPNSKWGMRVEKNNGQNVTLAVMSPANALVGEYKVFMETKTKKSGSEDEYLIFKKNPGKDDTVIVLFNAWCQADTVYMGNDQDREEYVMNPSGKIWVGSKYYSKQWNFGQFENVCLKTCLYVLDKCQDLKNRSRGDPVMVTRFITKMANQNDDGGILVGNWSGNYKPHTSPSEWIGSVKILLEYHKTKEGVKYGQCWVFSGLVTTLCRTIGIPTRSVTNFDSAHDTDSSTTIDFHNNEKGEPLGYLNHDSVWNFHVWNESFFKRPDLPDGKYDGWQAIDATPQESSQGVYCCGPAPLKAIKEGNVFIPYDTRFIFGECNGDRVYWIVDSNNGEMEVEDIKKSAIGKDISTKAVGSSKREDLTDYYKHQEGTKAERDAVRKAFSMSTRADEDIYKQFGNVTKDVEFEFKAPDANLMAGSDFDIQLKIKNMSKDKSRTVDVTTVTRTTFYTGITAVPLDTLKESCDLKSSEEKMVSFSVPASTYIGKTPADTNVKVFITAKVKETGQVWHEDAAIVVKKPEIEFEFKKEEAIEKKKFKMTLSFKNPLQIPLENGIFNIETSRYVSPNTITETLKRPVKPQEKASVTVTLEAQRRGWRYVIADFSSDQLTGIDGRVDFKVNS